MIDGERGCIDYDECGDGPTVVLVPGSCSTGAAWRPIISQWENGFRCVTTSLLGYGGTAERRTALDADISHEAEMLEAVIRRASCPVHLVGHSFGGLVALAVALRNRVKLLSLAIIEAPAAGLLRSLGEHQHYRAFREMTDSYFAAFHAGEEAAIGSMIDFYGGAGAFAAWPQRVRSYAVETTAVNILDWAVAYGFQPTSASLAKIEVPTLVLRGGASHPAVQRANELLGHCMQKASVVTLAGAAHFMISTHAEEVAWIIAHHVACTESLSRSAAERSSLLPGHAISRVRGGNWIESTRSRFRRRFRAPSQEGDVKSCLAVQTKAILQSNATLRRVRDHER
jgi:pimeloyl-ACP methyl ester carboxylesterase